MAKFLTPGKYLVIDVSMNQWLGTGMPSLKKISRKPHPIDQEFKTLVDHHTSCIVYSVRKMTEPKRAQAVSASIN